MKVQFFVAGKPVPQGSIRSFAHRTTNKVVSVQNDRVLDWRATVAHCARENVAETFVGPVSVACIFWIQRPFAHYGTGRNAETLKPSAPAFLERSPDIDKLCRSILDSLQASETVLDDAQVVELHAAKVWADRYPANPGYHAEGVTIEIAQVEVRP